MVIAENLRLWWLIENCIFAAACLAGICVAVGITLSAVGPDPAQSRVQLGGTYVQEGSLYKQARMVGENGSSRSVGVLVRAGGESDWYAGRALHWKLGKAQGTLKSTNVETLRGQVEVVMQEDLGRWRWLIAGAFLGLLAGTVTGLLAWLMLTWGAVHYVEKYLEREEAGICSSVLRPNRGILYTDQEAYVCRWMENLVAKGLLEEGTVRCTKLEAIGEEDLDAYRHVHLFAGIGGWPAALQLAGWPQGREIWTASMPCQPFSQAGNQQGVADERHVWPEVARRVRRSRPELLVGEQVPEALNHGWWDEVVEDLEEMGYAAWGVILPAAAINAPHPRHRLYWAARAAGPGEREQKDLFGGPARGARPAAGWAQRAEAWLRRRWCTIGEGDGSATRAGVHVPVEGEGEPEGTQGIAAAGRSEGALRGSGVGDPEVGGDGPQPGEPGAGRRREIAPGGSGGGGHRGEGGGRVGHTDGARRAQRDDDAGREGEGHAAHRGQAALQAGAWDDTRLVARREERRGIVWCRVGAGVQCMADGVPERVARLRGLGNAIVPQVGAVFMQAVMVGLGITKEERV